MTLILFGAYLHTVIFFDTGADCARALDQVNRLRPGFVNGVCVTGAVKP